MKTLTTQDFQTLCVGDTINLEKLEGLFCRKGGGNKGYEPFNRAEFAESHGKVVEVSSRMVKISIKKKRPAPSKKLYDSPRYFHIFNLDKARS